MKESYGAIPDIPSLAPEMFAEVKLTVPPAFVALSFGNTRVELNNCAGLSTQLPVEND